jgi:hypothetical protein
LERDHAINAPAADDPVEAVARMCKIMSALPERKIQHIADS